jgi:dipeptidyl aminopeptidase/acylaminoacyl peptidase
MPDGSLVMVGSDLKARYGIYRVDATTGAATLLVSEDKPTANGAVAVTADGERLFYRRIIAQAAGVPDTVVTVRNLKTGESRDLFRQRNADLSGFGLSGDGQALAFIAKNTDGSHSLQVMPASGGDPRTILSNKTPEPSWGGLAWLPDGKNLLLVRGKSLWRVPTNGDAPVNLNLTLAGMKELSVSPDGRRLAIVTRDVKGQVWVMENLGTAVRAVR